MRVLTYSIATAAALAAVVWLAAPRAASACIHPPKGFIAPIDSGSQRGLIFFDNGRQELIIQPGYRVNTEKLERAEVTDDGIVKGLKSFAWLVPLPALPDSYAEAEATLFDDLQKFTAVGPRLPEDDNGERTLGPVIFDDSEGDSVEFFEVVKTGAYTIQPIKAQGELGGKELAAWLKDNEFGEVDERILRFYLLENYYWLAIKWKSEADLPADGSAKPLQISFKTPKPVYPLKINDKRGEFDLELWLITREAVDLTKSRRFGIATAEQYDEELFQKNRETGYVKLPESVRKLADPVEGLKDLRKGAVFCYRFLGKDLDAEEGFDLGLLQEDLYFEFEKNIAAKPKDEVKPDETRPEGEEPKTD